MKNSNFMFVKIKEIGNVVGGATPVKSNKAYYGGNIPWITPDDLSNNKGKYVTHGSEYITKLGLDSCSAQLISEGSLLITSRAPIGYMALAKNIVCTNQGFKSIIVNEKADSEYLYYFLQTQIKNLKNHGGGTTYKELSKTMMEEFPLRILKDINVQKEIAHTLGSIDAKIDNNDCINAELESLAKLIYDYWFVQFEFPNDDGKPYKSSGGKMVWNEIIKREIPDGWDVDKIGVVLKTVLGGTPSTKVKSYWENGNINWLSSAEMAMFPNVKANAKITKEAVENSATKIMPAGTVALSITRYIRPTILGIDTCANQSVVGILESDKIKKDFIYPCIMNLIKKFLTVRTGAQQPHINKETIDSAFIVIPPDNVLDNYYVKIASMYDLIINIAFENKELTELRDFLVPLLMNGQVTINSKLQT